MATIRNVSDLVLWDEHNRVLTLADGTADVNPKNPAARYFRIRWTVAGVSSPFQLLIGVDRVTVARAAHRELLDAWTDQTEVDDEGWPVTGRRPATGRLQRRAMLPGPVPARRTKPEVHPAAGLGFLDYFDQVYVPQTVKGVKGNTSNQYRSMAVAIDRHLVRGTEAITVATATTADLVTALTAAAATGGQSRRKTLHIVAGKVFKMASTSVPQLRTDNPMVGVQQSMPKQPLVNLLDGRNPAPVVTERVPTYRDARKELTFWDVVREILPHVGEFYRPHVWMRLIAGPRPCELSDLSETSFNMAEGYVLATNSLTLQSPKFNGGQRLMRSALKARAIDDERVIPLPDIPECRAALQSAIDTAQARATARRARLQSGRARPRSADANYETWLASELAFTEQPRVFTSPSGAPFDATNFDRHWRDAVHAAFPDEGDPRRALRFYDLREIAGDTMKSAGVSVAETGLLLGHSERLHRQHYTERRIGEVTNTAQRMTEYLDATRHGEPAPLAAVIPFPTTA